MTTRITYDEVREREPRPYSRDFEFFGVKVSDLKKWMDFQGVSLEDGDKELYLAFSQRQYEEEA